MLIRRLACADNIDLGLSEIDFEAVDWINLVQ
jgi:hypothetical protein